MAKLKLISLISRYPKFYLVICPGIYFRGFIPWNSFI